jgi:hypothetical protein
VITPNAATAYVYDQFASAIVPISIATNKAGRAITVG